MISSRRSSAAVWASFRMPRSSMIIPALAAGCTVVLKAAHDTPWSATMLGRVASQCPDLPPGAFNVLTSTASGSLGAMLTGDPRVDVISFTGSTATGRRVMENASKTIKRTLLELGGKSAMIILDDADFSQAYPGPPMSVPTPARAAC